MPITINDSLAGIDWVQAKVDLAADEFDNGRSPAELRSSFERSQHVAFARDDHPLVGWRGCSPMESAMPTYWTSGRHRRIDVVA